MATRGEDEFTQFVVASSGRLFRTAYAVCGDHQLAEDALQAGYASAYASWRRVCRADNPEAYVQRIVLNQLFTWRRRRSSREVPTERLPEPGTATSHEELLVEADLIWRALQHLPLRRRAVVVLRYVEDLSVEDTARALGIRPGTVKSQSAAGLSQLRGELDPVPTSGGGAR